jgi:SAM-dependent MidA family methyltransferase
MEAALYHPHEGYYCKPGRKRWGRGGDYRTSPERSELFAATFGRYFAGLYDKLQKPAEWTIVEVGGGDGNFARGLLQSLQEHCPHAFSTCRYVVDEASINSRQHVEKRIAQFGDRIQFETLPNLTRIDAGIIFSNELLDAFPVHRLTKKDGKVFELYVTTVREKFVWSLGQLSTPGLSKYCGEYGVEPSEGQIVEINLAIETWLANVAEKLNAGYLITVDYGAETRELQTDPARFQGTLRAYYQHQFVNDVLTRPGELDITTTIDWTYVKRAGERFGFEVVEFSRQDKFLLEAGLLEELERQTDKAQSEAEKLQFRTNAREMILPGAMGSSYQVLVMKRLTT